MEKNKIIELSKHRNFDVFMIGAGATGSNLLSTFTRMFNNSIREELINYIVVIDGDKFEKKNMINQKCTFEDIGSNKAKVLSERYKKIYPKIDLLYSENYIFTTEELINILDHEPERLRNFNSRFNNIKLIIGCIDNDPTRLLIENTLSQLPKNKNYIYIDSGNGTENMKGQVYINYKIKEDCDIISKNFKLSDVFSDIKLASNDIKKTVGCAATLDEFPQLFPTNLTAATILNQLLYKIIINGIIPQEHLYTFDAKEIEINKIDSTKILNRKLIKKD